MLTQFEWLVCMVSRKHQKISDVRNFFICIIITLVLHFTDQTRTLTITYISSRNDVALNVWYFGICDQFPEDPWIHFCNVHMEAYLLFK